MPISATLNMHRICVGWVSFLVLALTLLTGCGDSSDSESSALLNARNINLIFVVSPDLANDPLGDINRTTANLSNQGLQRSLLMATYLKQRLLDANNVTGIFVLEPMTHLQTANNYPDMAAIGFIQQFALLNQITILGTTGYSYPLGASYGGPGDVPSGVATPVAYLTDCQGLVFNDASGNNAKLVTDIIDANVPGFYVFSAPWETASALMADIKAVKGYSMDIPTAYKGSNFVYVISIDPSGNAGLFTFDSNLNPPATYPVLPAPVECAPCTQQNYFSYSRTGGVNGAVVPAGANTNQTVYMIRHAEAHPVRGWDDGNYIGTGQWRALALPDFLPGALRGLSAPTMVYSVDPAQSFPITSDFGIPYVRPSLTVLPYAIANNLPYNLAASFLINMNPKDETAAENAKNFFFTNSAGANLSNQTILMAWEHAHFPLLVKHLLDSYGGTVPSPTLSWPSGDYDTIWTVTLDSSGNVTVNNALCEGIGTSSLPAEPPLF
jgi:hypothetical protein